MTLAPNLTEIVFAVGAGDTLVGVSEYSDFPPEARSLPRVGGLEVSAETVASLHPDLVIAAHGTMMPSSVKRSRSQPSAASSRPRSIAGTISPPGSAFTAAPMPVNSGNPEPVILTPAGKSKSPSDAPKSQWGLA